MATDGASLRETGFVATFAAFGGGLGGLVAAAHPDHASTCSAAMQHAGACLADSVAGAKPYVTAALVGLMLAMLVAIAIVLTWREVRRPRPARRPNAPGLALAHRPRH